MALEGASLSANIWGPVNIKKPLKGACEALQGACRFLFVVVTLWPLIPGVFPSTGTGRKVPTCGPYIPWILSTLGAGRKCDHRPACSAAGSFHPGVSGTLDVLRVRMEKAR